MSLEANPADVGLPPDDIHVHHAHDHVAAVFADRPHAIAAVDELRSLGLGSEHLGIAVRSHDAVAFEHDADAEMVHDVEVGAASGGAIGAIAGIGLAALAIPGIGVLGVGGMLAVAGASALWGGVLGGCLGAAAAQPEWAEHQEIGYATLKDAEVLVVVCGHGHADAVRDILQRHAGRLRTIEAGQM